MAEFEHEDMELIVCPWCGFQYQDSWEFPDNDETDCDECEKKFKHRRIVDITYDTERSSHE